MRKLRLLLAALCTIASGSATLADAYPNKLIRLIVPFAPGGNTDVVGRIAAEYMAKVLKSNVVVENRVGAGSLTGTDMAAKAPPDGYTLCVCGIGALAVSPHTEKLPFDPLKDFAPISLINTNPMVLLVNSNVKAATAVELVALSKSTAGGMNYATAGIGGLTHFAAEIFRVRNQMPLTAVTYRGCALATTAIVTGEVPFGFASMNASTMVRSNG